MFSKSCEYGIKAVIYLATQTGEGERSKVPEIAQNAGLPIAFTAKLLRILTQHGIVSSQTGPNGGFYMEPNTMHDINLEKIVLAIDGNSIYEGCGLGLDYCDSKNPCPLHNEFIGVRNKLKIMLQTTSIQDLAVKLKKGESVLIR